MIGNGKKIKFWKDNWLDGRSPKELALLILRLAKRKLNCLKMDLENNHWLSLLNQITSLEEIDELIQLGSQLQNVTLLQDCPDDISWKWTDNGQYSAKSAYLAQFQGYITHAPFKPIWTTQAEPKQRFFGWILLHQRALTAENLLKRRWPCDWICCLCTSAFEDNCHLAKECPFSTAVWDKICQWQGHCNIPQQQTANSLAEWWNMLCQISPAPRRKKILGDLIVTWWNIWIERNRRIFQHVEKTDNQVAFLIQENINQISLSKRPF